MPSFGVDQHQSLIGGQAAQGRRSYGVGAIGKAGPGEIERGQGDGEGLVQFADPHLAERILTDDIYWRERLKPRAAFRASASDDDLFDVAGVGRVGGRGGCCKQAGG